MSFLLLAQKKGPKKSAAKSAAADRWFWQANAHEESLHFVITFLAGVIGRSCCCILIAIDEGAVFFVCIH